MLDIISFFSKHPTDYSNSFVFLRVLQRCLERMIIRDLLWKLVEASSVTLSQLSLEVDGLGVWSFEV
jgi:hypothetical protein